MFYDKAKIYVRSGDGGDGMIGFRREKHVPLGGPDGGDGGKGGDIFLLAESHLNSLIRFYRSNHYRAGHGKHGSTKRRHGAQGEPIRLPVPVGTVVRDAASGAVLADLIEPGQEVVIVQGGRGGRGNVHFATSVNQAPRLAERGEPGKAMWLTLELKLAADVGIVGVPNAGKSTLLSVVSAARPKIADYPFTTLQPNLGVVTLADFETMVFADIPGLIEGAAEGIGLGHEFLRHIERTRVLIHLIDGAASDPLDDWAMINQELALHDTDLDLKPQLVVLNKIDLGDAVAWQPMIAERVEEAGYTFCSISAATGEGVQDMLRLVKKMLDAAPKPVPPPETISVIGAAEDDDSYAIQREGNGWRIHGQRIERIAAMTYFEFDATLLRFQKILEQMGISRELANAGVKAGDTVFIGEQELEWGEE